MGVESVAWVVYVAIRFLESHLGMSPTCGTRIIRECVPKLDRRVSC